MSTPQEQDKVILANTPGSDSKQELLMDFAASTECSIKKFAFSGKLLNHFVANFWHLLFVGKLLNRSVATGDAGGLVMCSHESFS